MNISTVPHRLRAYLCESLLNIFPFQYEPSLFSLPGVSILFKWGDLWINFTTYKSWVTYLNLHLSGTLNLRIFCTKSNESCKRAPNLQVRNQTFLNSDWTPLELGYGRPDLKEVLPSAYTCWAVHTYFYGVSVAARRRPSVDSSRPLELHYKHTCCNFWLIKKRLSLMRGNQYGRKMIRLCKITRQ